MLRRFFFHSALSTLFAGGALAAGPGAAANPVLRIRKTSGQARRCILVYLLGGPPHQDMWDLKPAAPSEIRGPFQPIATATPGIQICQHMPRLAQLTDRMTIIRSLGHNNSDHPFMTYYTLTGRVSSQPLGANSVLPPSREDDPHMGAVVSKFRHQSPHVPGYVAIPEVQVRMATTPVAGGGRAGFLGPEHHPLAINGDPQSAGAAAALSPPPGVSEARIAQRQKLLATLDGFGARIDSLRSYQQVRRRAAQLSDSGKAGLLALDAEPAALRDRYGRHRFGQSLLLSRRLIERGVSFVGVHFNHMSKCDGWDTHKNNFQSLEGELLPMLDQGLSALLTDLEQRGLLDETLVVCLGEFGRTPRINKNAGRDHWGQCGAAVLAGGGVRGGNLVGASDASAAYPTESPVGPPDLVATIYHALGIHPHSLVIDSRLNRTLQLSDGNVIPGVF